MRRAQLALPQPVSTYLPGTRYGSGLPTVSASFLRVSSSFGQIFAESLRFSQARRGQSRPFSGTLKPHPASCQDAEFSYLNP